VNWSHPDQFHWRRDDGRYFVDQAVESRYTAWFKQHADTLAQHLGCYETLRLAIERCKQHEKEFVPPTTAQADMF
jgi:hypothetical protein